MNINFFKFTDDAKIPTREHDSDAGIDIYCTHDFSIYPNSSEVVGTGIGWNPQSNIDGFIFYAQIKARSGWAITRGIECSTAGVIDESYRGEWKIKLFNTTRKKIDIKKGSKIAQAIIFMLPKISISEIDVSLMGETDRGSAGFGSSGF